MSRRKQAIPLDSLLPIKENEKIHLKKIRPLTKNQELLMNAIETSVITFAIGPAGVGKDYISCYCAMRMLLEERIEKVAISRPMIEAGGESIGYLPGTDIEKMLPFVMPMLDCFDEFIGEKNVSDFIKQERIVVKTLAHMRGATFKNSVVIIDEVQNCNETLLKLTLTRPGNNCRLVMLADKTQSDLGYEKEDLARILRKLEPLIKGQQISLINFSSDDVVRSGIVKEIVKILS